MKIKASQIKPGMLILRDYKRYTSLGKNRTKDYVLVTAKKGFVKVEYTHFNSLDGYSGRMIGFIDGKEKVKVITKKRLKERIVKEILNDRFQYKHDVDEDIDTLRLIQSMDART